MYLVVLKKYFLKINELNLHFKWLKCCTNASSLSPGNNQIHSLEDNGKVPLAAILKEKVYVSTTYINYIQNICVSSINAGMSASLLYMPPNVYNLIRPNTRIGLLIVQPGCNGFLREIFLPYPGSYLICVSEKAKPHGVLSVGNYSQKAITLPPESNGILHWVSSLIWPGYPQIFVFCSYQLQSDTLNSSLWKFILFLSSIYLFSAIG